MHDPTRDDSRCTLCGKSRQEVKKLILGVYGGICLECVELCVQIICGDGGHAEIKDRLRATLQNASPS
ncbi:MAG: hypothetical protein JO250_02995 [Armatimonadetes bacterium]|nr:hypothetical protein [Armatimonadota bacterium]